MERRKLGQTGISVSKLSFGASSLGQEFRSVDLNQAIRCVHVALEHGMNFIDTSPYYGRGLSECLLGKVLPEVPRDSYYLCTKLGRYAPQRFDFSARRVHESIDISLERMRVEHLDLIVCHDIEFVDIRQVIEETLPALRSIQQSGKVRWIGISGYPMKIFSEVLRQTNLDFVLSYNHYTLQNTMLQDLVPFLQGRGVGILNAAPFSARLLADAPLPVWHKAPPHVREVREHVLNFCRQQGWELAKIALQFSVANTSFASCIAGSADPDRVAQWCRWVEEPLDMDAVAELQRRLAPIHNWFYTEGRPENNDPVAVC
ncbi:MAG: aldo/keto reductase [Planctomycetaceae bacterium]|nr:aldo/keto reductase [Planctomycetaceae bacterium]